jgi:two-component system, NarL family, nitrate/nitrite response regulator NarL
VISLAIVADIRLYREGLAEVLDRQPGIRVVGTAGHDEADVRHIVQAAPDVVLLDMAMPTSPSIARMLGDSGAGIAVLALGVPETEHHVLACAKVGAAGYVPREGSLQDLLEGVRQVARGEAHYSPRLVPVLLQRFAARGAPREPAAERLTARELEIVELIDQGLTNQEIAKQLYIELATVKNHVHNILEKLHLRRRTEAAAWVRAQRGAPSAALSDLDPWN